MSDAEVRAIVNAMSAEMRAALAAALAAHGDAGAFELGKRKRRGDDYDYEDEDMGAKRSSPEATRLYFDTDLLSEVLASVRRATAIAVHRRGNAATEHTMRKLEDAIASTVSCSAGHACLPVDPRNKYWLETSSASYLSVVLLEALEEPRSDAAKSAYLDLLEHLGGMANLLRTFHTVDRGLARFHVVRRFLVCGASPGRAAVASVVADAGSITLADVYLVRILMTYGADADEPLRGRTALEMASQARGRYAIDMCETLLAGGADPNRNGLAQRIWVGQGLSDIAALFVAAGGKVDPASRGEREYHELLEHVRHFEASPQTLDVDDRASERAASTTQRSKSVRHIMRGRDAGLGWHMLEFLGGDAMVSGGDAMVPRGAGDAMDEDDL